jgi:uncharacterized membrane protein
VAEFKPSYLIHGLPGHPLHPPLTDATIGTYTFATAAAVLSEVGVAEGALAQAWWLALVVGLVISVPTALSGLADWLLITRGTDLWKTATLHLAAMVTASVFFLLAAVFGHSCYAERDITAGPLLLTLVGFALLTTGGWLGGSIVCRSGMGVAKEGLAGGGPGPHRRQTQSLLE